MDGRKFDFFCGSNLQKKIARLQFYTKISNIFEKFCENQGENSRKHFHAFLQDVQFLIM